MRRTDPSQFSEADWYRQLADIMDNSEASVSDYAKRPVTKTPRRANTYQDVQWHDERNLPMIALSVMLCMGLIAIFVLVMFLIELS